MIDYIEDEKTKDIQKYGLEILSEFHEICKENELKYILDYGTLLGAVRHKGFIPWDDDIDVAMTREDFNKFHRIANKVLPENMFLQTNDSDENYYSTFAKIRIPDNNYIEKAVEHFDLVHGPWMDIFIYDYKYDDENLELEKQKKYNKRRSFYSLITPPVASEVSQNRNIIKEFAKDTIRFILQKSQSKKNRGLIMKYLDYKYNKLKKVIEISPERNSSGDMLTYSFGIDLVDSAESLSLNIQDFENRKLQRFEDYYFYIPKNYKEILVNRYGNYCALPPYEERKSNHQWVG